LDGVGQEARDKGVIAPHFTASKTLICANNR